MANPNKKNRPSPDDPNREQGGRGKPDKKQSPRKEKMDEPPRDVPQKNR